MDLPYQFENDQIVIVHSTNSELDGMIVRVIGCAVDYYPNHGSIYIIQRGVDERKTFSNGFYAICLTEACLKIPD